MNVLSLFDGMSCGQIALERAGIKVDNYYASEIDKYAIQVTQKNYPETIQLGDVTKWREWDLPKIDLILAGSPCQGFSFAGKQLAFDDPRSKLFFDFIHILEWYDPQFYLLENVKMSNKNLATIDRYLPQERPSSCVLINSSLVSAQNRPRYYWNNFGFDRLEDKNILLKDILEDNPSEYIKVNKNGDIKKYQDKMSCLCGGAHSGGNHSDMDLIGVPVAFTETRTDEAKRIRREFQKKWGRDFSPRRAKKLVPRKDGKMNCLTATYSKAENTVLDKQWLYRRYTPIECERGQTVPDNYTEGVSNTQRYKMLGNGWTIDVIVHILKGIK